MFFPDRYRYRERNGHSDSYGDKSQPTGLLSCFSLKNGLRQVMYIVPLDLFAFLVYFLSISLSPSVPRRNSHAMKYCLIDENSVILAHQRYDH